MKDAYVRVKDKAEHGYYSVEDSPEEYATDRVSALSGSALHEAGHQLDKRGRKAVKETKDNIAEPYWFWYGFSGRVEWCACFASWCANECGYIDTGVIPKFAGCVPGAEWFKEHGQWEERDFIPDAGQIIFFDGEGDGETDHVGIVESSLSKRVHGRIDKTVEFDPLSVFRWRKSHSFFEGS